MFKKPFLTFFFLPAIAFMFTQAVYGQEWYAYSLPSDDIIANYKHLSPKELFDTANYHSKRQSIDTALICYNLVVNTPAKDTDAEHRRRIIDAYNESGLLYIDVSDYRKAYELLIKALDLCEKYQEDQSKTHIYMNIGNIYYRFDKYDMAEQYYSQALSMCTDSLARVGILNNLGVTELGKGDFDRAFSFLEQALQSSKRHNNIHLDAIWNSMGQYYHKTRQYDAAFRCFRLSLNEVRKDQKPRYEAENLLGLGELFLEVNEIDSALLYVDLSNAVATKNNFPGILADNYLLLSKIEESKGHKAIAFEYFKTYASLKDSIFNTDRFSEINQFQRLYEVSKTNRLIEQMAVEQQIKERTIRYQQIFLMITIGALALVSGVLLYVFFQKRRLNTAYKTLFEKNLKIIELQERPTETHRETDKKNTLTDNVQRELLDKIVAIMEDTAVICHPDFSLDKLAELVQSNQKYVSQTVNTVLKINFRSFLNGYRIREAQRLFAELDTTKFTIESVALKVGFKSPSAFRTSFKEVTGVSPSFYLKSIQTRNQAD